MVGQEGERSSLVKVAGLGIVVVLLIAGAVYVVGELADNKTTEYGEFDGVDNLPLAVGENGENLPDWLIEKKDLFGGVKYVIDRDKLPLEGAGIELVKGNDNNYDDGDMKPNDGVPEMMAGIDVVNGNVVVVIDNDFEEEYGEIILKLCDESNNRVHHFMSYTEIAPDIFRAEVPIEGHNTMGFVGKSMADSPEELEMIPIIVYEKKKIV